MVFSCEVGIHTNLGPNFIALNIQNLEGHAPTIAVYAQTAIDYREAGIVEIRAQSDSFDNWVLMIDQLVCIDFGLRGVLGEVVDVWHEALWKVGFNVGAQTLALTT